MQFVLPTYCTFESLRYNYSLIRAKLGTYELKVSQFSSNFSETQTVVKQRSFVPQKKKKKGLD